MPRKPASENQMKAIVIGSLPILGFVAAMLWNSFMVGRYAENIATKADVGQSYKDSVKYTDESAAHTLRQAFDHSDTNRQGMMLEMEKMKSEIKTDQAKIGTKVDSVIEAIQELRADVRRQRGVLK